MAKLERKSQKVLGGASGRNGQFGSAQSLTRILSNDPDVIQALPAWESGWNSAVMTGDRLPAIEEFQGVDYVTTYQLSYLLERGIPEYSSDTEYHMNALAMEVGTSNLYRSIADNNLGNPLSDITKWRLSVNFATVQAKNNYTATDDPDANDDESEGYSVGSIWYNTVSGDSFLLVDATDGAAVWIPTSISIGNLGSAAFEDVGTAIGNVTQLINKGGIAAMPSVDGSNLTGVTTDADLIVYDPTDSGLSATDVQEAIDEIVLNTTFDATRINYDNSTSGLAATEVQGAIDEIVTNVTFDAGRIVTNDATWVILDGTDAQTVFDNLDVHLQGVPKFNAAASAPSVNDDQTQGYQIGSWWVDTSSNIAYACLNSTTGAAVWRSYTNVLNNYTATTDPDVTDDQTQGYSSGSIWFNSTSGNSFLCTNAATGAAVWIPTSIDISDLGTAAFENYGTSVGDLVMFENDGSGGPALPASSAQNLTNINAESIGDGSVTNAEFEHLDGVSDNIQSQINAKQATITGAATSITSANLTANMALVSDGDGKVGASSVTSTELGRLSGVTSSIQNQLNNKQGTITGAASSIVSSDLTASRVMVSDGSGKVSASSVTTTTLGYLDATSSIQTQLNNKIDGPLEGDISTSGSVATINVKFATPVSLGSGTHTCSLADGDWHRITTTGALLTINANIPNGKAIVIEGFGFDTNAPNVSAFDWGAAGEPEWTDHDIFIVTRNNDGDYIAILVTQGLGA